MGKLALSIAIGDYDRIRPLALGRVRKMDGVAPIFMHLEPEEIFFRAFRHQEFDICELSLSSFTVRIANDDNPYIAVPVFPSRAFRHTSIYVRTDRGIERPEDLRGRRIGTPEYQLSANVYARAILEDYSVRPSDISWVRGGLEQAGRQEKIPLALPDGLRIEQAPADRTLSDMLAHGEIDGIVSPRAPSPFDRRDPAIRWLFPDPVRAAEDWYGRTGVFPIMHVLGIRRSLLEQHAWLAVSCMKAFSQAKDLALRQLADTSATKVTLPFVEERLHAAQLLMGPDFWPYGFQANRRTLEYFLSHHHRQGLSSRLVAPEELFAASSLETHRI